MNQYHKIKTLFKRNPENMRYVLEGQWAKPEFEYLKDNEWIFTEKVDGTNIRVMWNGKLVSFGGKTDNAQMYMPLVQKLQKMFDTTPQRKQFKELFGEETEVCLYGEGYGRKIQKAGKNYNPDDVDFVLFDIKIGRWWLSRKDIEEIAVKLGIKVVPIVLKGTLLEGVEMVKKGFNSQWGDFPAEGLVAKPEVELFNRSGERVITKLKVRDFQRG